MQKLLEQLLATTVTALNEVLIALHQLHCQNIPRAGTQNTPNQAVRREKDQSSLGDAIVNFQNKERK